MAKLLVKSPSGEQKIIEVDDSGSYFDKSRVIWDTRKQGEMPVVTIGKMQLVGNRLVTLDDYLPEHAATVRAKTVPKEVPITAACEALINAGLYVIIDEYINTLSLVDKIWWEKTDIIHRQFPLVAQVQEQLKLTDEQIDDLFISAEQIRKTRSGEI